MSVGARILLPLLAVTAFLVTAFGLLLVAAATRWWPSELPDSAKPLFVLAVVGLPTAVAVWVGRGLARRWRWQEGGGVRPARGILLLIGATYIITAVFGIPAAQSYRTSWAVAEYKRVKASGSVRVWEAHPRIRTYAAIPIAPGLILFYHEYQIDGLYGFGGFELALWYGVGVKSLGALPLWLS